MYEIPDSNEMFPAVRRGHIFMVEELMHYFGLSHSGWSDGYNLICEALRSKQPETAQLLLINGAKVISSDIKSYSNTPLHYAVTEEYTEIVSRLLRRNIDLNALNSYGETALHIAIEKRSLEIVKLLIDHKVRIHPRGSSGINPILMSLNHGELEILKELVNYGIRTHWPGTMEWLDTGCTLLHLAVLQQDVTRVDYLLNKGLNVDAKMTDGKTPLHIATILMNVELVKFLLKGGANIEAQAETNFPRRRYRWTPLFFAYSSTEIVNILVANNANVNAIDNCGETLLHVGVISSNPTILNILIENGANVNAQSYNGYTPLHSASDFDRDLQIYETLVKRGANIDAKDKEGLTALHLAATSGYPSVVRFLLDNGADINATCNCQMTPLYHAYEKITGNPSIYGELINAITILEQTIITMISRGQYVNECNRDAIDEYYKVLISPKKQKIDDTNIPFHDDVVNANDHDQLLETQEHREDSKKEEIS